MSKALIKSSIQKQKLHVKYLIQKTTETKKFDKDYKNLKAKKKKKKKKLHEKLIEMSREYQVIMRNNERNNR